jgi:hypothetical protein
MFIGSRSVLLVTAALSGLLGVLDQRVLQGNLSVDKMTL